MARFIIAVEFNGQDAEESFNDDIAGMLAYTHAAAKRGDFARYPIGETMPVINTASGNVKVQRKG